MVCNLLKTWTRVQFAKWPTEQGWALYFKLTCPASFVHLRCPLLLIKPLL